MNDVFRRLIELERRQLELAHATDAARQRVDKVSQDTHIFWQNTVSHTWQQGSDGPGTNYPWNCTKLWVNVQYDTSLVNCPYTPPRHQPMFNTWNNIPLYGKVACDWMLSWVGGVQQVNTAPIGSTRRYWNMANPGTQPPSNDRYYYSSIQSHGPLWASARQTFVQGTVFLIESNMQRTKTFYTWNSTSPSLPRTVTSNDFPRVTWQCLADELPYDPVSPQYQGSGSSMGTGVLKIDWGDCRDYWSAVDSVFGARHPSAPNPSYVSGQNYYESYEPATYQQIQNIPCNIIYEWA